MAWRRPLRGFWKLTWLETKIFVREPMGLVGTLFVPVAVFLVVGRVFAAGPGHRTAAAEVPFNAAVLGALMIAFSAVQSLVAIVSIYREGGILKRLRSTPLSPVTILGAHVAVKLAFTVVGFALLLLVGRRAFPGAMPASVASFGAAVLLATFGVLSLGFVIASVVPTARFAQPIGAALLYPMLVVSGLFFPVAWLPLPLRAISLALPTTHAVALLQGIWEGGGWAANAGSAAALVALFVAYCALASRVFRWE